MSSVELTSNCIVKCLLGKVAGLVRRVENLIIEDGEVEGKTKTDGMSRGEISLRDFGGSLVGLERLVSGGLALIPESEFGEVTVVVALPEIAT